MPTSIWLWSAEDVLHRDVLSEEERQRAAALREPLGAHFTAARVAVRTILADLLGVPGGDIVLGNHPCPGCGDAGHGPPRVVWPETSLWISMSRSEGYGALAVSTAAVGVDIETHRPVDLPGLSLSALAPAEVAWLDGLTEPRERLLGFYRCWTRKEAVLKAVGVGMSVDLRRWDTEPEAERGRVRDTTSSPARLWTVENPPPLPDTTVAVSRPAGSTAGEGDVSVTRYPSAPEPAISQAWHLAALPPGSLGRSTTLREFRALKEM
ncbi:4'-phosphopantetheinyl transferase family protein [Streptomyces sp. uw30]|uniref:4'-phosphopantetheinyl transferase family protein n=1 Tax=Streptomyces sp. uw30 TaxID=1828179 RepID=UPI001651A964|nr:4'-phosphopantetheinyl transferase superfamily protein [Streptomyces sp. uw30]